jgi:hypothetical protein
VYNDSDFFDVEIIEELFALDHIHIALGFHHCICISIDEKVL